MSNIKENLWPFINKTLFRIIPNQIKWPRNLILGFFGAKVAATAQISRTVSIYNPWNFEIGHLSILGADSKAWCAGKVIIGENCRIGKNVSLLTSAGKKEIVQLYSDPKPIVIEKGCWISADASILQGVVLAHYTMVGEKSIVTENTNPYSVVMGNPAREIQSMMNSTNSSSVGESNF